MRVLSLLVLIFPIVSAGIPAPKVTVDVNVGDEAASGSLGGLEPRVQWQTGGNVAGVDFTGGVDVQLSDAGESPAKTSLWGKAKKSLFSGKGEVSIRGDMDASDSESVGLDVRANGFGTALKLLGRFDANTKTAKVAKVEMSKDIDTMAGKFSINPKYNVQTSSPDVTFGFSLDNTSFQVDAEKRRLTVAHSFTNQDTISPAVTASGDFSLSYTRDLDSGKLTTTYASNDSIKVMWSDGEVVTTFKAPLEGFYTMNQGLKVNIRRSLKVPSFGAMGML